jgi:hypothetical protein
MEWRLSGGGIHTENGLRDTGFDRVNITQFPIEVSVPVADAPGESLTAGNPMLNSSTKMPATPVEVDTTLLGAIRMPVVRADDPGMMMRHKPSG